MPPLPQTAVPNVEFIVRAAEDLVLAGSVQNIVRVTSGNVYSCLMLKTQRFSSLFRHYAKHHGLKRDDLEYSFTDIIQADDTPETIYLQVFAVLCEHLAVADSLTFL